MIVGVVQRVHVGLQALAQGSRQLALVADGGDGFQVRAQRGEAFGFDGRFVHVRVIEVGDLSDGGTGRRIGLGGFFDQAGGPLVAQVGEGGEDADSAAVGGDFGTLNPSAVGVLVKIVAWLDGGVHVGHGDAVSVRFGRLRGEWRESGKSAHNCVGEERPRGLTFDSDALHSKRVAPVQARFDSSARSGA